MFAADFRAQARAALRGRWVMAVITGLLAAILGAAIFSGFNGELTTHLDLDEWLDANRYTTWVPSILRGLLGWWFAGISLIIGILAIIQIVIGGAATLGYAAFNLDLADGVPTSVSVLFSQFYRLGAGFCMQLLRAVFIALWSLLFVIPGIMAAYSYAMAPYILVEHPGMSASEALSQSKAMMYGNRWRLFCLHFSFIGWYILCAFTMGIGLLWVNPYKEAAQALFYREISSRGTSYQV